MWDAFTLTAYATASIAVAGLVQAAAGWWSVRRHDSKSSGPATTSGPAVTILKPLHGDEPLLEEALASFCGQDYGPFQIVFGLQDPADPALAIIRRLRVRYPEVDIAVVIDPTQHGVNRKVSNLINMLPAARHDIIVMADSDIHATPSYLAELVSTLQRPGVGLVTTLYAGFGSSNTFAARMGMSQINHSFLPGALMARLLGRQDCLGATMALRRETLERVGGLQALVRHLADDAVLGRLVAELGLNTALAHTVPFTTVPELRMADLFAHELRWGRTIQSLAPIGFALSSLQYPLFWAALTVAFAGACPWSLWLFAVAWLVRGAVVIGIDGSLGLSPSIPVWLLPLRDAMSVAIILASYCGTQVAWRGHVLHISPPDLAPGKG
jgi:ceramide glucosyltransferase